MDARYQIRAGRSADAPALAVLERATFSDPWSEGGLREMLESSHAFALLAEWDGALAGYIFARWVADSGEILNLAVAGRYRRKGLGLRLLDEALTRLADHGIAEVYLEVRASNRAARALYTARGFRVAGMRRAYYREPTEDALVLKLALGGAA